MSTHESTVSRSRNATRDQFRNLGNPERLVSAVGGGALAAFGLKRRDLVGAAMAVGGSALLARGVSGHCPVNSAIGRNTADTPRYALKVESNYTINCTPDQLYAFWRRLENLPHVMRHLQSVSDLGGGKSHWVAHSPGGRTIEWDATTINDVPNETIAWQSVEGSSVDHAGAVRFSPAPGNRGTQMRVTLEYNPPGGKMGALFARTQGEEPKQQIDDDIRHFKQMMEAGEVPTVDGQPTGKAPGKQESLASAMLHSSR